MTVENQSPWKNVADLGGGWTHDLPASGLQSDSASNWATEAGYPFDQDLQFVQACLSEY